MRARQQRPEPCTGGGQPASHTYTRPTRGPGGVVRPQVLGNCPANHDQHFDLALFDGRVQPHAADLDASRDRA